MKRKMKNRGFFGVGIENTKCEQNIGTLWRTANILGADFIFTIGKRYKHQASDTMKTPLNIPLYNYENFDDFYKHLPNNCPIIGIELDERSKPLKNYVHPTRCVYLLGAEDHGLTTRALNSCHELLELEGDYCMNVSVAGSIVLYDRINKI